MDRFFSFLGVSSGTIYSNAVEKFEHEIISDALQRSMRGARCFTSANTRPFVVFSAPGRIYDIDVWYGYVMPDAFLSQAQRAVQGVKKMWVEGKAPYELDELWNIVQTQGLRLREEAARATETSSVPCAALLKCLDADTVHIVFTLAALERCVVFCSDDAEEAGVCCFALRRLLFPLQWCHDFQPWVDHEALQESMVGHRAAGLFGTSRQAIPTLLYHSAPVWVVDCREGRIGSAAVRAPQIPLLPTSKRLAKALRMVSTQVHGCSPNDLWDALPTVHEEVASAFLDYWVLSCIGSYRQGCLLADSTLVGDLYLFPDLAGEQRSMLVSLLISTKMYAKWAVSIFRSDDSEGALHETLCHHTNPFVERCVQLLPHLYPEVTKRDASGMWRRGFSRWMSNAWSMARHAHAPKECPRLQLTRVLWEGVTTTSSELPNFKDFATAPIGWRLPLDMIYDFETYHRRMVPLLKETAESSVGVGDVAIVSEVNAMTDIFDVLELAPAQTSAEIAANIKEKKSEKNDSMNSLELFFI